MPTPVEASETTYDKIQVSWVALSSLEETGGTLEILSYEL
jgi:hypothetical protein